jgi:heat shock protein HslJ
MRLLAGAIMAAAFGEAAAGEASLAGKWRIAEIRDAGPFDSSETLFEVAEDGRVRSTVGCNRIAG